MASPDPMREQQSRWDEPEETMEEYFARLRRQRAQAVDNKNGTSKAPVPAAEKSDALVSAKTIPAKRQDVMSSVPGREKRPRLADSRTVEDTGTRASKNLKEITKASGTADAEPRPNPRSSAPLEVAAVSSESEPPPNTSSSKHISSTPSSSTALSARPSVLFADGKTLLAQKARDTPASASSSSHAPVTRAAAVVMDGSGEAIAFPSTSRSQSDVVLSAKARPGPKRADTVAIPVRRPQDVSTERSAVSQHKAAVRAPKPLKINTSAGPGDKSFLTDPGSSPIVPPSSSPAAEEAPVVRKLRATPAHKVSTLPAPAPKKGGKQKAPPIRMYASEWAKKIQPALFPESGAQAPQAPPTGRNKFMKGLKVYYYGGDREHASEGTRTRMSHLVEHGAMVLPSLDLEEVTHVVHCKNSSKKAFLRVAGLRSLDELPERVPIVKWDWVVQSKVHHKLMPCGAYAAWREPPPDYEIDTSFSEKLLRAKQTMARQNSATTPADISKVSEFTESQASSISVDLDDTLSLPGSQNLEYESSELGDKTSDYDTESEEERDLYHRPAAAGFKCDQVDGEVPPADCPNQKVINVLEELKGLHAAKRGEEDKWKVFSYTKAISALRTYPKPIRSLSEAKALRGVGEKTAKKIMEIVETGSLRRIAYENTEEVKVGKVFTQIYGVGPEIAHHWFRRGCRTLTDVLVRKGGIVLTPAQEIGLQFYDDIIQRMPREETKALFDLIKPVALSIDPKLFVEVMGSYRRGKSHCGDIDILISRDPSDGKTHAGVLPQLLNRLHEVGIITEDLALPDQRKEEDDLEAIYRGLCRLPGVADSKRRRIDFLCIPWHQKGAALIYYTGDDIFNRSLRLKARKKGYSLNQRGLWADVVRDPRSREKTHGGRLIASATEEEIFKILDTPWQEPHQRIRNH